jgi:2-C-methyl-D-erythritol 4-phosphate cytidylyltransferase/2-C-methyl-D-erythritol 2,4-cyclodiphosphate synthase
LAKTGAVVVAAGRSERMAGVEKMLAPLAGEPLLLRAVRPFESCVVVDEIVVVTRRDLEEPVRRLLDGAGFAKLGGIVRGGETRAESARNGFAALSPHPEVILVHDGARPLVSTALIERVARAAAAEGAAVPGVVPVSTIRREEGGRSAGTVDRERLREAQTPQGFRREVLARAFADALRDGFHGTDEAACVERSGAPVALVPGERTNLKVTVPQDLLLAEALLSRGAPTDTRVGSGYDVHRLVEGRPLRLGGVDVPHDRGLAGWSDADVLSHAVCDALLGGASLGDLGDWFPDTDPRWKGASGAELLTRTVEILSGVGYVPRNVDATVRAEAPRLAPYRRRMIENLARALGLAEDRVSVKFTTTEGLGFEGEGLGISASAVALLARRADPPHTTPGAK